MATPMISFKVLFPKLSLFYSVTPDPLIFVSAILKVYCDSFQSYCFYSTIHEFNCASPISVHVSAVVRQRWFSAGLLRAAQIHPAERLSGGAAVLRRPGEQQAAQVSVFVCHFACLREREPSQDGGEKRLLLAFFPSNSEHFLLWECLHTQIHICVLCCYFKLRSESHWTLSSQCKLYWRPPVGAHTGINTCALWGLTL